VPGLVVVLVPVLFVLGVIVPLAGVVPEGVVVVVVPEPLVLPPTEEGLGEMVLGEPVTVEGVVPLVLVRLFGKQLAELELVPIVPVEEVVPVDEVVLGEAVVPLVPVLLAVPAGHG
jgi:hypothetical protein